jgi:hypothetical protein
MDYETVTYALKHLLVFLASLFALYILEEALLRIGVPTLFLRIHWSFGDEHGRMGKREVKQFAVFGVIISIALSVVFSIYRT